MENLESYPMGLQETLENYQVEAEIAGRIGDRIVKLANPAREVLYLKISKTPDAKKEMLNELAVLNWLSSKDLKIPKVLRFEKGQDQLYMLLSNVAGLSAHQMSERLSKEAIINLCAIALKKIHRIDAFSLPSKYRNKLASELKAIGEAARGNRIDVEAFQKANNGNTPAVVFEYLQDRSKIFDADVFTHGDYCLPNILIVDQTNYGFVDWSEAGIGDIYRDLASISKSIARNFGEEYQTLIFKDYGISPQEVNQEKIDYYNLIDQFAYYQLK